MILCPCALEFWPGGKTEDFVWDIPIFLDFRTGGAKNWGIIFGPVGKQSIAPCHTQLSPNPTGAKRERTWEHRGRVEDRVARRIGGRIEGTRRRRTNGRKNRRKSGKVKSNEGSKEESKEGSKQEPREGSREGGVEERVSKRTE